MKGAQLVDEARSRHLLTDYLVWNTDKYSFILFYFFKPVPEYTGKYVSLFEF